MLLLSRGVSATFLFSRLLKFQSNEQMIAKKIPGEGRYYNFKNPKGLADVIYSKIDDSMANEAKIVFNFATKLFIEMYDVMQDGE